MDRRIGSQRSLSSNNRYKGSFPKMPFQKNSWKTWKYNGATGDFQSRRHTGNELKNDEGFHRNVETRASGESFHTVHSRINYSSVRYNPITQVAMDSRVHSSNHRQKGVAEHLERNLDFRKRELNPVYQHVLKNNPKVFHRKSGDFTMFSDTCLRNRGIAPFYIPETLLRNK